MVHTDSLPDHRASIRTLAHAPAVPPNSREQARRSSGDGGALKSLGGGGLGTGSGGGFGERNSREEAEGGAGEKGDEWNESTTEAFMHLSVVRVVRFWRGRSAEFARLLRLTARGRRSRAARAHQPATERRAKEQGRLTSGPKRAEIEACGSPTQGVHVSAPWRAGMWGVMGCATRFPEWAKSRDSGPF